MVAGTEIGLVWENGRLETDSPLVVYDPSYRSGLEVTVSQQLMKGSSKAVQTSGIRAAEKTTAAVSHLAEKQAVDLAAQVKKTYWELVFARQDIEVKELSLKLARVEIFQPESEIARREEGLIAIKTIEATRKTSLATQKMLEAEQEKFHIGLVTANDVLESQDSYAQALASEKRALVDPAKAHAELERIQGIVGFRKADSRNFSLRRSPAIQT